MIYFFDSCAIARYYCDDLGSYILRKSIPEDSKKMISYLSLPETISALKQCVIDTRLIAYNQEKYEIDRDLFLKEVEHKFVVIRLSEKVLDMGVKIVDKLGTRGADSVILATALLSINSMVIKFPKEEMIFVTSDMMLYLAACKLSQKYKYLKVLHFWSCKCNKCGQVFIANKHNKILCPNCNAEVCGECNKDNCKENFQSIVVNTEEKGIKMKV